MSQLGRAALKAFFEAGDTPTESQFVDFIDSVVNIIDDSFCSWQKVTINFDDFQPDATKIKYINAFNVPAGYQVNRFIIIPTTRFLGSPITNSFIKLYEATDTLIYINTLVNTFSNITDRSGITSPGYIEDDDYLIDISAGDNVRIMLEVEGELAEINDLIQGSLDIYYKLDEIL